MKIDYREIWWKQDAKPEDDEVSFKEIVGYCVLFAGMLALAIIGFHF